LRSITNERPTPRIVAYQTKALCIVRARQSQRYAGETMKMVGLFVATATTTGVFQVRMPLCSEIALNLYKEAILPKLMAWSFAIDGSTRQSRALSVRVATSERAHCASSTRTRRAYNQQWYAENRECTCSRNRRWHKRNRADPSAELRFGRLVTRILSNLSADRSFSLAYTRDGEVWGRPGLAAGPRQDCHTIRPWPHMVIPVCGRASPRGHRRHPA
jgi:hypothetical protein